MMNDDYKYRIAIVNEKVRMNINPTTLVDMMRLGQYIEGQTYMWDLQRFRPLIKIQTFIDLRRRSGKLLPDVEKKRKAVVRDWFRLVLWFIRLRKCAKGRTPVKLLEVEERIQRQKLFNGVVRAKQARLKDYVKNHGSDGETSSDVDQSDPYAQGNDDISSINEDEINQEEIKNQLSKMKS